MTVPRQCAARSSSARPERDISVPGKGTTMDRRGGGWVGIAAGAIGCISAIWWMPYYPIWSLTYIAIGALVIYALAAYGGKAEAA